MTREQKKHIEWWKEWLRHPSAPKQIRNQLAKVGGRCCLGGQCDIFQTMVGGVWDSNCFFLIGGGTAFMPPEDVRTYFGISKIKEVYFSYLNDTKLLTFPEIADRIDWVLSQPDKLLKKEID